jgi:hypothetical protein
MYVCTYSHIDLYTLIYTIGQLQSRLKALAAVRNKLNGIIVHNTEDVHDNHDDIDSTHNNNKNKNDDNSDKINPNNNNNRNLLKTYISLKDMQHQMIPLFPAQKNPEKTIKKEKFLQNFKKKIYNENSTYSTYDKNYQNISYSTYDNIEIIESSYVPINSRNDAINIFIHIKNVSR